MVRLDVCASGRDCATPSIVTTRFAPSAATEIVCADVPVKVIDTAVGGARPVEVFPVGLGAAETF